MSSRERQSLTNYANNRQTYENNNILIIAVIIVIVILIILLLNWAINDPDQRQES